ncbi:MAG: CAP domain-containing protein [Acidobacteriota bacterium]
MAENKTKAAGKRHRHNKRWMRATRGSTSFIYVSIFILGIGLLCIAAAIFAYIQSQRVIFAPVPSISYTTEVPDTGELLRQINDTRRKNDLSELEADDRLKDVAEARLKDMIDNQQYSHQNYDGKFYYDLLPEHGYAPSYSCENLDIEPSVKPAKFVSSWLKSGEGHKECLLNDKVQKSGIASGKFSRDDKSSIVSYLVVAIFATEPPESDKQQE